ncbi:hypothetical protein [Pseudidiomarina sp.]|uniref:hypothetical protein n=1 Tax=Pseudidiomarina sp. TaxID=2081707 RepID=UPI003A982667
MFIDDVKLSAFLDNELEPSEAEAIRAQLEIDDTLAERLSALAMVDLQVGERLDAQLQQPIPAHIYALLEEPAEAPNVVSMGRWQQVRNALKEHVAMAAGVALMVGFGFGQWLPGSTDSGVNHDVAFALETQPSGIPYQLDADTTLTAQLTFKDDQGDYCRQYQLTQAQQTTVAIQCRRSEQWHEIASVRMVTQANNATYQTASGQHVLDPLLDQMMRSAPLTPAQEKAKLIAAWKD